MGLNIILGLANRMQSELRLLNRPHHAHTTPQRGARELIDEFHKSKAKSKAKSSTTKLSDRGRTSLSAKDTKADVDSASASGTAKRSRGRPSKADANGENGSVAGTKRKRNGVSFIPFQSFLSCPRVSLPTG